MNDRVRYLLRTQAQIGAFRLRFGEAVKRNAKAYTDWINSLEYFEWTPVVCRPEHEEFVTGLICLLYIDGEVNISFDNTATKVQNEPRTEEEMLAWMKRTGWHGPGIDRPEKQD